jgi:peptidoglycan hydrolase CwlO-like protein
MKLKYRVNRSYLVIPVIILIIAGLQVGAAAVIRVKAVGLASPGIPPGSRARTVALRAAKVEGYKKLARAANLDTAGEAHIKGARVVSKTYHSDYKVEIVMEMPLPQSGKRENRGNKRTSIQTEISSLISSLKKDIKAIETWMAELEKRLDTLKKKLESLEQEIKKQD